VFINLFTYLLTYLLITLLTAETKQKMVRQRSCNCACNRLPIHVKLTRSTTSFRRKPKRL